MNLPQYQSRWRRDGTGLRPEPSFALVRGLIFKQFSFIIILNICQDIVTQKQ